MPNKRTHPNKRTTPHSKKFFKNIPTQINVPLDKPKGFSKFHTTPLKSIPPLRLHLVAIFWRFNIFEGRSKSKIAWTALRLQKYQAKKLFLLHYFDKIIGGKRNVKIIPPQINIPPELSESFWLHTHAKPPPNLKSYFANVPVRLFGTG